MSGEMVDSRLEGYVGPFFNDATYISIGYAKLLEISGNLEVDLKAMAKAADPFFTASFPIMTFDVESKRPYRWRCGLCYVIEDHFSVVVAFPIGERITFQGEEQYALERSVAFYARPLNMDWDEFGAKIDEVLYGLTSRMRDQFVSFLEAPGLFSQ